jgi:hypothetical protein
MVTKEEFERHQAEMRAWKIESDANHRALDERLQAFKRESEKSFRELTARHEIIKRDLDAHIELLIESFDRLSTKIDHIFERWESQNGR